MLLAMIGRSLYLQIGLMGGGGGCFGKLLLSVPLQNLVQLNCLSASHGRCFWHSGLGLGCTISGSVGAGGGMAICSTAEAVPGLGLGGYLYRMACLLVDLDSVPGQESRLLVSESLELSLRLCRLSGWWWTVPTGSGALGCTCLDTPIRCIISDSLVSLSSSMLFTCAVLLF